jgi:hypothetical protein
VSTIVIILVTIIYARGINMSVFYKQFGAEYNCDAYGAGAYDSDQVEDPSDSAYRAG